MLDRQAAAGLWEKIMALPPKIVSELERVIREVPTEASAVPVECARGASTVVYHSLSRTAQAVCQSSSLEEANQALHAIGIKTELDLEREKYQSEKKK